MEITWFGQSFFRLKGKSTTLLIDPFDPEMIGLKLPKDLAASVALSTHNHGDHNNVAVVTGQKLTIAGPGEYEVEGVTITGTRTFHDATGGSERGVNTVYNMTIDGINIVHLGDLGHQLSEEQVTEIGNVHILLIPVGGVYTITAAEAAKVVAQLEPRIVIPMHYKVEGLKAPLEELEPFLKEMGTESVEALPKLSITKDKLPEETTVVVLSKS